MRHIIELYHRIQSFLVCINLFKRIKRLEKRVGTLDYCNSSLIMQVELLKWALNNKPKFKINQRVWVGKKIGYIVNIIPNYAQYNLGHYYTYKVESKTRTSTTYTTLSEEKINASQPKKRTIKKRS